MYVELNRSALNLPTSFPLESSLQRRVSDIERERELGGTKGQAELRRIRKERDQLKEATSQMESELIQVYIVCIELYMYTVSVYIHACICTMLIFTYRFKVMPNHLLMTGTTSNYSMNRSVTLHA